MFLLVVLGGSPARAGMVGQVSLTTSPAPATTPPPVTAPRTVPPTAPRTTLAAKPTATTRRPAVTLPTRYAPAVPYAPTTAFIPPSTIPTTTTTIAGIGGRVPVGPVTVPLHTTGSNGHVDPTFAWLSGVGFAIALAMVAGRLFVTRPGGRDRAPLT